MLVLLLPSALGTGGSKSNFLASAAHSLNFRGSADEGNRHHTMKATLHLQAVACRPRKSTYPEGSTQDKQAPMQATGSVKNGRAGLANNGPTTVC